MSGSSVSTDMLYIWLSEICLPSNSISQIVDNDLL